MEHDLILVGTGFSSSFFLYKWLEKRPDAKVLVLERGRRADHAERIRHEQQGISLRDQPSVSDTLVQHNADMHVFNYSLGFGGGSNCWWGCVPRFLPNDFRMQSEYAVGEDWPISYEDIEPYYEEAEQIMYISGPNACAFPKSQPYPLPPHTLLPFDQLLKDKYSQWVHTQPTARASHMISSRPKCCGNSVCHLCPIDAKFTIENGLEDIYEQVEIQYGAHVHHLDIQGGEIKGVVYEKNGQAHRATASLYVLGANPIFNAHILKQSGDPHPLLGKGIGEQRSIFATLKLGIDNSGGSTVIPANMWMLYDGPWRSEHAACLIESYNAPNMIRLEKGKLRHIAKLKFIFEDLYNIDNQLLDDENENPVIHYHGPSSYLLKAVKKLPSQLEKLCEGLPVEDISIEPELNPTEHHIIGGHVMGKNASRHVVDEQSVHHLYRNLVLLGAGNFPTMSPANPTLTLSALALRTADKLATFVSLLCLLCFQ